MAGPTTVLSDSASPQRPRPVKSPFIARRSLIFDNAGILLQSEVPSSPPARSKPIPRPLSFHGGDFSEAFMKSLQRATVSSCTTPTTDPTSRSRQLLEGKVGHLVKSFSNSVLHQAFTSERIGPKFGRSLSQVIESPGTETSVMMAFLKGPQDKTVNTLSQSESNRSSVEHMEQPDLVVTVIESPTALPTAHSVAQIPIGPIARGNFKNEGQESIKNRTFLSHDWSHSEKVKKQRVFIHQADSDKPPVISFELSPMTPNYNPDPNPNHLIDFLHENKVGPRDCESDDEESEVEDCLDDFEGEEEVIQRIVEPNVPDQSTETTQTERACRQIRSDNADDEVDREDDTQVPTPTENDDRNTKTSPNLDLSIANTDRFSTDDTPDDTTDEPARTLQNKDIANESTDIARQYQQDQKRGMSSTKILVKRPDGSTESMIIPHGTPDGSEVFAKRQRKRDLQATGVTSDGSLSITTKKELAFGSGPLSPSETASALILSPGPNRTPVMECHAAAIQDHASIPTIGRVQESLADEMTQLSSGTRSTSTNTRAAITVDTQLSALAIPASCPPLSPISQPSLKEQEEQEPELEQEPFGTRCSFDEVISSKISRRGALFAKKIKTIAAFQYNTGKKLGRGNFGIVYQGNQILDDQGRPLSLEVQKANEVAIKKITKKLPREIEALGLVRRELEICEKFGKQIGIVPLRNIVSTNKHHYIVLKKAEGDLAQLIKIQLTHSASGASLSKSRDPSQPPLTPSAGLGTIFDIGQIRCMMEDVVKGLQILHSQGYSHKDIKPANILHLKGKGMLCDFGLCSNNKDLPDNQFFGTQEYASPEARRVTAQKPCNYIQSDIYSLGAVIYELATGAVLSKVISQGLSWGAIQVFGGKHFADMLRGMISDTDRRWTIDRVVDSPFWREGKEGRCPLRSVSLSTSSTLPSAGLSSGACSVTMSMSVPSSSRVSSGKASRAESMMSPSTCSTLSAPSLGSSAETEMVRE